MTIIVSNHILSEIEQMATTVGIINHGQLLLKATYLTLKKMKNICLRPVMM